MGKMDTWIGETGNKALIEGEILLPVNREDIAYILAENVNVNIEDTMASSDKILIKGSAVFSIIYVDINGKTDAFSVGAPFSHTLDVQNLTDKMNYEIRCRVEDVSTTMLEPRKLKGSANVAMEADVWESQELSLPDTDGLELQKEQVSLPRMETRADQHFSIREDVRVPQGMPPVERIIDSSAYAKVDQVKKDGDKIVLTGEIKVTTVYTADDTIPIWQMNHVIPFEEMVEMGKDTSAFEPVAQVCVKRVSTSLQEPELFTIECSVLAKIKLIETVQLEVAKDAYSVEQQIACTYREWSCRQPVSWDTYKYTLREHVVMDQADMGRPLTVFCLPVLTSCYASEGSVAFEGELHCTFFYLDQEDQLKSMKKTLPVAGELDVPAAKERMAVSCHVNVEQQSVTGAGTELELRVALEIGLCLNADQTVRMVQDIDRQEEMEGKRSTLMIYFPDDEESRWDIGKQFAIKDEQIVESGVENRLILFNPLM